MFSNHNKKESLLLLIESFLLKDESLVLYRTVAKENHDLLIYDKEKDSYLKILVATVSFPKPIVSLFTKHKQKSVFRDYDILYAIQPESLIAWRIPRCDIPDFESLYLSKKYDSYRISFLDVTSFIHNPELFSVIKEQREKDKTFLKSLDEYNDENNTIEDIFEDNIKEKNTPCSDNEHRFEGLEDSNYTDDSPDIDDMLS